MPLIFTFKRSFQEVTTYESINTVMNRDEAMNYPIEYLNSLEPAGVPPHCLNLKLASLIILSRNINQTM